MTAPQTDLAAGLNAHRAGDFPQAEKIYHAILTQNPNHPEALHLLGVLAHQTGQHNAGADLIARAIALRPNVPEFYSNHGLALYHAGRLYEASEAFQTALKLSPNSPEAHNNLGLTLAAQGLLDESIESFRQALRCRGDYPDALCNLGSVLRDKKQFEEAIECCRAAIRCKPDFSGAYNNLGYALAESGRTDEAIEAFESALRLQPDSVPALSNLAGVLKELGRPTEAAAQFRAALRLDPDSETHSDLILTLYDDPTQTPASILAEQKRWNDSYAAAVPRAVQSTERSDAPHRKIRIGYISADFRDHPAGRLFLPLLREHDRQKFEIFCYANLVETDSVTERFRNLPIAWRAIPALSNDQAVHIIQLDNIDILVDLSQHSPGNRLLLFARKPAPVQATFPAFPAATGVSAIDFRLTDPHLDPPDESDADYLEKSIRLPGTFCCYDEEAMDLKDTPEVNPLPAITRGHITFGCLNPTRSVNDTTVDLWASVLAATPNSRLLLQGPHGSFRNRILTHMESLGISRDRIQFAEKSARPEFLNLYHNIDIGLDTIPFNGHVTTLDSFWMGVPVITQIGRIPAARTGLSHLDNVKLSELAAKTPEEFVAIATTLAADLPRLKTLRAELHQRMHRSPIMNAKAFAQNVETAYLAMLD